MKYKVTVEDWLDRIREEKRVHDKKFRNRARKIYDQWREEKTRSVDDGSISGSKFNILYSNTSVIHAAIYAGDSRPDIRRRFRDSDKDARQLAELMERALDYSNDEDSLSEKLDLVIDDYLVSGLGIPRIRYVPYFEDGIKPKIQVTKNKYDDYMIGESEYYYTANPENADPYNVMLEDIETDENGDLFTYGEPEQSKVWEKVETEIHPWDRFGWQPANNWENVNWIYFEHFLEKDEVIEQFGIKAANTIPYGYDHSGENQDDENKNVCAKIYEVYDRINRKICIFADGDDKYLAHEDDPLKLEKFYPVPKPLMANVNSTQCIPIPDYIYYQDQARELDKLTFRISRLTDALRLRGVYDSSFPELEDLFSKGDNQMVGIDSFEKLEGLGFDKVLMFLPIEELSRVLVSLIEKREEVKQTIYEITGISDILRGATKASETLGAQQMKQMNAGARADTKDRPLENMIRELYRLKVEVIVEHFDKTTLELMTGIDITPEMERTMKSDMLRCYKISIETEATMSQDAAQDKKDRIEVLRAITEFVAQTGPLIQSGMLPIELAKELLLFGIKGFKQGRQLEHLLESIGNKNEQEQNTTGGQQEQSPDQPGGIQPGQAVPGMGVGGIGAGLYPEGGGDVSGYPQQ